MICDENGFLASVHQLTSFSDMLVALCLDAEETQNYSGFALQAKGWAQRVHELNTEIREYMQAGRQAEAESERSPLRGSVLKQEQSFEGAVL